MKDALVKITVGWNNCRYLCYVWGNSNSMLHLGKHLSEKQPLGEGYSGKKLKYLLPCQYFALKSPDPDPAGEEM